MKACHVRDLPPIPADVEERALAARTAISGACEELGDGTELIEAFLALGHGAAAEMETTEVPAHEVASPR